MAAKGSTLCRLFLFVPVEPPSPFVLTDKRAFSLGRDIARLQQKARVRP